MTDSSVGDRLELVVGCVDAEGATSKGVVVDILGTGDPSRLVVSFPANRSPRVAVGSLVELHLSGTALAETLTADAQVVYSARESTDDVVQFAVAGQVAAAMDVVFGRRRSFRVQPDQAIQVELRSGGGRVVGDVVDLSVSGASVVLGSAQEAELADWNPMLRFRLPGDDEFIEIAGQVRFRKLVGATVRLGIEFDRRATLDYSANENRIAGYVLRRQTQVLRAMIADG